MKRRLTSIIFSCLLINVSYAQPSDSLSSRAKSNNLYMRAGLGYAVPQAAQTMDVNHIPFSASVSYSNYASEYAYNIKKASFSAGLQAMAGIGYMLNKNIGIEVDVALGAAPKKYKSVADSNFVDGYAVNETITQYAQTPVYLIPALLLQTGNDKTKLYARAGIIAPVKNKVIAEVNDAFLTPATITSPIYDSAVMKRNQKLETASRFNIGFSAALGITRQVSKAWHIWAEASLMSLSFYAKETDVTAYNINGSNELFNLTGSNLKYKYAKSGSGVIPANNIGISPTYSLPFSNFGINIGVAYSF